MTRIFVYLTFNGNCREAMTFYHDCFGGELNIQTVGDSPLAERMPLWMRSLILHSTLANDSIMLMASDIVGDKGLTHGNDVSLMLHCDTEDQVRNFYKKLSDGGEATHPLQPSFSGALFGDLTDRFGNQWLLHYEKEPGDSIAGIKE